MNQEKQEDYYWKIIEVKELNLRIKLNDLIKNQSKLIPWQP